MLIKASFSVYVSTNNYRVAAAARTRVGCCVLWLLCIGIGCNEIPASLSTTVDS